MEVEASFSQVASPVFDGENYDLWAVRMESYLEALDLWEALEKDYNVPTLPGNPTMAQIKKHKERKTKKAKRYEASITTLENTKDLSKITLARVLHALQAQEQRRLMRQDCVVDGALPAKQYKGGSTVKWDKLDKKEIPGIFVGYS
ncbi:uncharacterized protein LOC114397108 [Glycine soja]|uniref:uncharacterized protein n=1 Tax=Glycine max TaxID=3847 RepID=UPI0003DE84EC|nr:uncharacterized protein LOC100786276 [Glycine max]XP_028215026.1 uncharacterized protein LOC114397108 [Glycine soja]|eukprot:XP_006603335.1 uncharacterized protein LOC100786276 [Glycine max]